MWVTDEPKGQRWGKDELRQVPGLHSLLPSELTGMNVLATCRPICSHK